MKLRFLGTGAAEGVPAIYCQCETCQTARERGGKELHSRTQVMVDETFCIDFPPDAYYHALQGKFDYSQMQTLIVTHSHLDHFYACDFVLRGYKYTKTDCKPLHIYGNAEVGKVYEESVKREMRDEVRANIVFHELHPFAPVVTADGYTVTALSAQHSKTEDAYVYLIEKDGLSYLHLTDTGRLPMETLDYLQRIFERRENKINGVCFDCTFLFYTAGAVSRHMGLGDNQAQQEEMRARGIVGERTVYMITHYSHNSNPLVETLEKAQMAYGYVPTYDGFEIRLTK
ncbi:MAG: hypothetical protein IJ996_00905 [Clostridia bacterium]|nr:hypothetical protein [Clostridia bacterium]